MTNTFTVRSIAQKTLFVREIKSKLSDGQWENLQPMDHWRPWCEAEVLVAPEGGAVGRNFRADKNYDLLQLAKNDIVRARMITDVKVVLTFGEARFDLIIMLYDSIGNWRGMPDRHESVTDAEDVIFLKLGELFPTKEHLDSVRTMIDLQRYCKSDLIADLSDLGATMRVVLK